ncbi:hypothetical protein Tco_1284170 [Tanacetum coccineum]
MDDSDLTMEEYIRLEEEKAQRRAQSFDWRSATYGKVNYFDDIDYFKDLELEFPAIVFNDTSVSKPKTTPVPNVNSPIVTKLDFDFKISFDESDDEDYTFAYDKNSFSYKLMPISNFKPDSVSDDQTNDLELNYNDDNLETKDEMFLFIDMALPPRDRRHPHLRFEGLGYTEGDIEDFEGRLGKIFRRGIHRTLVLDFRSLLDLIAEGLTQRMVMEHMDAEGVIVFSSKAWRILFDIRGPLIQEYILEFFSTFRFGEAILELDTIGALQF